MDLSEVTKSKDEDAELTSDMHKLLFNIKDQIDTAKEYKEKIQPLTLIPESWSNQKAVYYFGLTEYAVKKAVALRDTLNFMKFL